ncbi:hypothetical protein, partial [Enterobacter hormaechei]|uniref:hypothetical protein n=1 Tax=Enterobacter hormaechei TaxID=158836 RepID=UPI0023E477CE
DLQTPSAFSPRKTDVAALRIRTLKSMASCMIHAKSLDPSLEVKAISTSTHILNRSPHPALDGKTPFEAWCGKKPIVTHFRVFGCPAWANRSIGMLDFQTVYADVESIIKGREATSECFSSALF